MAVILRKKWLPAIILTSVLAWTQVVAGPSDPYFQEQQEAVLSARNGEFESALQQLARLREQYPDARALLIDQTLVLAWANQDQQVIDNAARLDIQNDTPQVLAVVAKAYRNLKLYPASIQWYQALLQRQPDNLDARMGLIMALADDNQFRQALAEVDAIPEPARMTPESLRVHAYVLQRQGSKLELLPVYDAMLAQQPGDHDILRAKALLFRDLVLPEFALELGRANPGILSAGEMSNLEADQVALSIRSASRTYSPQGSEWRNSERSLSRLDAYLSTVSPGTPLQQRLQVDRLIVLVDSGHMREAVAEYELLLAGGYQPPVHVRFAAAQAYLGTNRAGDALRLLGQCLDQSPDNLDYQVQYFYALLELGRLEEATVAADTMLAGQAQFDKVTLEPNPAYLEARLRAVLARSYADQLQQSQDQLEQITAQAPNNTSARQELASVYLWRGWPDRALDQYQQVLTVYPSHLGALAGWTTTQLARQEFGQAGETVHRLQKDYPDARQVQQLAARWSLHEKSELVLDASFGNSTGVTFGSRQYTVQGWWYTPPVRDWFRFYAHSYDGFAELPEGNAHRPRMAAGMEYRRARWNGRTEISARRWGGDTGLLGELNWRLSDTWSLGAGIDLNSYGTPLRAYKNDVSSDQAAISAFYNPNELRSLSGSLAVANFDDGNHRFSIGFSGRQRVVNQPLFKLDATGYLDTSRNSLDTASYYNPTQDRSLGIGADMRWRRPMGNTRSLYHRLYPRMGSYYQESYGSNSVWSVDYEFGMRFSDSWALRLGVQRARHAYDGEIEYSNTLMLGLEGRL